MNQSDGNALDAKIEKVVATLSRKAREIGSYLSNVTIIFFICLTSIFFICLTSSMMTFIFTTCRSGLNLLS